MVGECDCLWFFLWFFLWFSLFSLVGIHTVVFIDDDVSFGFPLYLLAVNFRRKYQFSIFKNIK